MVEIYSEEKLIAVCGEPRYVKVKPSTGCYIQCKADEAEGVAVRGQVYSLNDKLDSLPKALIREIDGGDLIFNHNSQLELDAQRILDIETALCDLDLESE